MRWLAPLREPAVQFLAIGLLVWALASMFDPERDRYRIEVGSKQMAQIAEAHQRQFGTQPSKEQLSGLVDRYIADEVAFREGEAMGLATDDEIVRRRVIQKYEFLASDQAVPTQPSKDVLARWYRAHVRQYMGQDRTSFTHFFFSSDDRGDRAAQALAQQLLRGLLADAPRTDYGDPFPGPVEANDLTPAEIARIFGNSQMAQTLPRLPVGRWSGPYRSAYGWHLARVTARTHAAIPKFEQVQDHVLIDFMEAERERLNAANKAVVRKRYEIRYEGPSK